MYMFLSVKPDAAAIPWIETQKPDVSPAETPLSATLVPSLLRPSTVSPPQLMIGSPDVCIVSTAVENKIVSGSALPIPFVIDQYVVVNGQPKGGGAATY